ncbi:unnamed protein product [Bursaphelenchus xylophilus]|uniref:(pine wood nematode) hypothetical protein n=1 Tax=Bursaphelenchus xylophilus TaxID=6326 RepID=A0A1I7RVZ5_BURXY|nr:unnamed protein product [Bursaphelenchus xylophilus]CAG9094917.1 unnamed protein product [Bursaphelenchus xylophilus]
MSSAPSTRSAGVKRLLQEAKELHKPTYLFYARPLEDNLFEWHFTFRGPPDTDFEGGIYHGRIILPNEYPMKPPNLVLLTPNGRFETNTKICLSISGYHPETWLPSWSIRTAILALIGFFPTEGGGALGSIECSSEVRKRLAKQSVESHCDVCGCSLKDMLLPTDEVDSAAGPASPSSEDSKPTPSSTESTSEAQPSESPRQPSESVPNTPITRQPTSAANTPAGSVQNSRPRPHSSIPLSLFAFGICVSFAAFVGLLARRLTF